MIMLMIFKKLNIINNKFFTYFYALNIHKKNYTKIIIIL